MDIFKLLSRSTNLQKSTSLPKNATPQHIPSAGFQRQFVIDDSDVEKPHAKDSKKRKRGEGVKEQGLHLPVHLDFFRNDNENSTKLTASKIHDDGLQPEEKHRNTDGTTQSLSLEECRRALKRHKLKIILLDVEQNVDSKQAISTSSNLGKNSYSQLTVQPLTSLKHLRGRYGLSRRLAENIASQGYFKPTEVQMGSLPLLLGSDEDRGLGNSTKVKHKKSAVDLLTVAPTGSGKTLAFLINVFHGLLKDLATRKKISPPGDREHKVQALIVAPTHELADQIANEGRKLAIGTGLRIAVMRKGMRLNRAPRDDTNGKPGDPSAGEHADGDQDTSKQPLVKVDILVSTPLMLLHAISSSSSSAPTPLPDVRYLVLDEADILLDPLFRSQTLGIWGACVHHSLQTSLWSATIGSSIETLARSFILDRRRNLNLSNSETRPHPIVRLVVGLKDSAISNVSHRLIYAATEQGKLLALRQLLHPTAGSAEGSMSIQPPFLVFTQTIPRAIALHAELLYDILPEAGGSSRIAVLHSDLSGAARSAIMVNFRKGEIWVLITTDLLSRGVDFRGVNGVVNYDIPNTGASYIHRVGRTGRQGREGGIAVTFYTKEDIPYVRNVANLIAASEKVHGQKGQESGHKQMRKWLLDALPTVSKKTKKELKLKGVESRRANAKGGTAARKTRISTKGGYHRKMENRRKGAAMGSRRRAKEDILDAEVPEEEEWSGIGD